MKLYRAVLIALVGLAMGSPCWAGWQQDVEAAKVAKEAKKYDEAIQLYGKALETKEIPVKLFTAQGMNIKENKINELGVRADLAACLYMKKDIKGAIEQYDKLMTLYAPMAQQAKDSAFLDVIIKTQILYIVYGGRSIYYAQNKQYDLAIADLEAGLKLKSDADYLYKELAWLFATCPEDAYRDAKRALEYANQAVAKEKDAVSLTLLAAAYAENGNFEEAVKTQEQAASQPNAQKYLESYKANKPWRSDPWNPLALDVIGTK